MRKSHTCRPYSSRLIFFVSDKYCADTQQFALKIVNLTLIFHISDALIDFRLQSVLRTVTTYHWYPMEFKSQGNRGTPVGFTNSTFTSPRDEVYIFRLYTYSLYSSPFVRPVSYLMAGYVNTSLSWPLTSFQPPELLVYLPESKAVSLYFNGSFLTVYLYVLGLSILMSESCMFSVSSTRDIDSPRPILFDRVLLNQCSMYKVSTGHFVAPKAGIYYLHINVGYTADIPVNVRMVTQTRALCSIKALYISYKGHHMAARSLVQLSMGEHVWVELTEATLLNTPEIDITKFQGFLYEPKHGSKVAWSVFLSKNYTGPHRRSDEPIKPVAPDVVLLNEGGVYDPVTHFFTIKTSGNYMLRASGGVTVKKIDQQWEGDDINVNTQDLVNGDKLYIVDEPLYGDQDQPSGFVGLLLYEM